MKPFSLILLAAMLGAGCTLVPNPNFGVEQSGGEGGDFLGMDSDGEPQRDIDDEPGDGEGMGGEPDDDDDDHDGVDDRPGGLHGDLECDDDEQECGPDPVPPGGEACEPTVYDLVTKAKGAGDTLVTVGSVSIEAEEGIVTFTLEMHGGQALGNVHVYAGQEPPDAGHDDFETEVQLDDMGRYVTMVEVEWGSCEAELAVALRTNLVADEGGKVWLGGDQPTSMSWGSYAMVPVCCD